MSERTKRVLKFIAVFVLSTVLFWWVLYVLLKYGGRHSRYGLLYDSEWLYPITTILAIGVGLFEAWDRVFRRAKQSPEQLQRRAQARRERRRQRIILYFGAALVVLIMMLVLLATSE